MRNPWQLTPSRVAHYPELAAMVTLHAALRAAECSMLAALPVIYESELRPPLADLCDIARSVLDRIDTLRETMDAYLAVVADDENRGPAASEKEEDIPF